MVARTLGNLRGVITVRTTHLVTESLYIQKSTCVQLLHWQPGTPCLGFLFVTETWIEIEATFFLLSHSRPAFLKCHRWPRCSCNVNSSWFDLTQVHFLTKARTFLLFRSTLFWHSRWRDQPIVQLHKSIYALFSRLALGVKFQALRLPIWHMAKLLLYITIFPDW